jgi:hypothetical protein
MDDETRTIHFESDSGSLAFLNGDTVIAWMLEERWKLDTAHAGDYTLRPDIEEDCGLKEDRKQLPRCRLKLSLSNRSSSTDHFERSPNHKDLSTQIAVWEGNVDLYASLWRTGGMTGAETWCVVRGIYHHTMYARWWAEQLESNEDRIASQDVRYHHSFILQAINARRVRINDLALHIDMDHIPEMIWGPLKPSHHGLHDLLDRCPRMSHQIAMTYIICDYTELYRKINQSRTTNSSSHVSLV